MLPDNTITLYKRSPDSLLSTLSRIGGLLALIKVSSVLYFAHLTLFQKELKKEMSETLPKVAESESNNA